jgi:hypothetical protein
MAKKLPLPPTEAVNLVLRAADLAPRQNGPASRQLDAAVQEVSRYFQALYAPEKKGE